MYNLLCSHGDTPIPPELVRRNLTIEHQKRREELETLQKYVDEQGQHSEQEGPRTSIGRSTIYYNKAIDSYSKAREIPDVGLRSGHALL